MATEQTEDEVRGVVACLVVEHCHSSGRVRERERNPEERKIAETVVSAPFLLRPPAREQIIWYCAMVFDQSLPCIREQSEYFARESNHKADC
jgi:hypothetical protein